MPPIRALPAPRGDCRGRPGFVDVALRNGHVIEASQHGHLRSLGSKHSHLHREPDGSDGKNSQVVEFSMDGTVLHIDTVPGHSDGLKLDPITKRLWALQNE